MKPEKIKQRYRNEVASSFKKILSLEYQKYFVQINPNSDPNELKNAILEFYFKNKSSDKTSHRIDLIEKALDWGCHQIAIKYFYNKSCVADADGKKRLDKLLIKATAKNQVEFLKLFLSMGVSLQDSAETNLQDIFDVRDSDKSLC